jgi:hypothetical protein
MTTENPFDGREHGGLVFLTNPERCFYIGLSPSQRMEWLQDHPERWQTREDALRDLQARAGTDVEAEPAEPCSTASANEVRPSGETDGPLPAPGEDKPQPGKPATNITPLTTANAEATAAAGDEFIIGEPRFISERRVAVMLDNSQRQCDTRRQVLRTRVTMRTDASVTDSDPGLGEPSRETEVLPRAEAATTETKGPKAETTLPGTTGRKRGRSGSQLGKQKPAAGISKSTPKLSPEIMRIVLNSLRKYPVLWHAASKGGIHRKTLEYWLKRSAAGDDGYDIKWQGLTQRFHQHCESAIDQAHQNLKDEWLRRAIDGYEKVLTHRGRVVYKIDQELVGLGLQGPDAYLMDENGKPVPETVHKEDTKAQLHVLKEHRPDRWGKRPKIDAAREGGVLVIGDVTKKPKYNTDKSVRARRWKADLRKSREEKD